MVRTYVSLHKRQTPRGGMTVVSPYLRDVSPRVALELALLKQEGTADGLECRYCGSDQRVGVASHLCGACANARVKRLMNGRMTLRSINETPMPHGFSYAALSPEERRERLRRMKEPRGGGRLY